MGRERGVLDDLALAIGRIQGGLSALRSVFPEGGKAVDLMQAACDEAQESITKAYDLVRGLVK
jgi:hypothetical protein